jgi:hypothetical protein
MRSEVENFKKKVIFCNAIDFWEFFLFLCYFLLQITRFFTVYDFDDNKLVMSTKSEIALNKPRQHKHV